MVIPITDLRLGVCNLVKKLLVMTFSRNCQYSQ